MGQDTSLRAMLEKHRLLDATIQGHRERFPSDWNGSHPFVKDYLGPELLEMTTQDQIRSEYVYFDQETGILDSIRRFHQERESLLLTRRHIAAGPGSSSLLAALALWLLKTGLNEVFYAPPLYYTFHYFLRLLGIHSRPVTSRHMFLSELDLRLPRHRTALLFCDPIWYAGRTVPVDVISQIAEWQKATGSFVIVDGSFQYMQWDRTRAELAATLDPELTFRLVSPAKSLAIPCFRFAYLLHPATIHEEFLFLYENLVGGSCVTDLHFAARSLAVLRSQSSNLALTDYLRSRYDTLISSGYLETEIQPNSGYFVFGLPREHRPDEVYMDQEFFELQGYQNYGRINLLKTIL